MPGNLKGEPLPRRSAAPDTDPLELCFRELARSLRHGAVGRRCLGIIHNLASPLQVMSFHLELLDQEAHQERCLLEGMGEAGRPLQELNVRRSQRLEQLRQQVEHLGAVVGRLIDQGLNEREEDCRYLDVNRLLQEELSLYRENLFFKHQVTLQCHWAPGLPPVWGHYIDLAQSFRNIVDNALEAMAASTTRELRVITEYSGGVRRLRVGDTGIGIPAALLPHLGKPFFTTKTGGAGEHPGLGLFLAQRLLAPYHGRLEVESRPGETWVTLLLPVRPGEGCS